MNYTKSELSSFLSSEMNLDLTISKNLVGLFFSLQSDALKNDKNVKISSFGSFLKYITPERTVRNLSTMQELKLTNRSRIRFKPSNLVKKHMNA